MKTRRRYTVTGHETFRKHLARFEAGRGGRGAEQQMSVGGETIGQTCAERKLGTDDGQVDAFGRRERRHGASVRQIDRQGRCNASDTWISRRAEERTDVTVSRQMGNQRVLARTTAEDE